MPGGAVKSLFVLTLLVAHIRLEAIIFRVGAGRVAPLIAQVASMDCFVGGFKEVMIIHHTGKL